MATVSQPSASSTTKGGPHFSSIGGSNPNGAEETVVEGMDAYHGVGPPNNSSTATAGASNDTDLMPPPPTKRTKTGATSSLQSFGTVETVREMWKSVKNGGDMEKAFASTIGILNKEIELLLRDGLEVFQNYEKAEHEIKLLKNDLKGKEMELERLTAADEKNRQTISNLLEASEKSMVEARDASRAALSEAELRADLAVVRSERDEVQAQAEEAKRKAFLLDEQLRSVKTKLSRVTQEKLKIERDQRLSKSIEATLENQTNSDSDYYKRRYTELSNHVQGLNAIIVEKNRQLDDAQRQLDRNISRDRMANLREEKTKGRKRSD